VCGRSNRPEGTTSIRKPERTAVAGQVTRLEGAGRAKVPGNQRRQRRGGVRQGQSGAGDEQHQGDRNGGMGHDIELIGEGGPQHPSGHDAERYPDDHPDAEVDVRLPVQTPDRPAIDVLAGAMGPPHFPITPDGLRGSWNFTTIEPGSFLAGGFTVRAEEIPHKGGRTYGFRVSDATASVAYLSDHGPGALGPGPDGLGERHDAALALADGVDLLLHDAQHTAAEYPAVAAYGHSSIDYAVDLGRCAGAAEVLLFHHDPNRTDDELDAIAAAWSTSVEPRVTVAREGDDRLLDRDR